MVFVLKVWEDIMLGNSVVLEVLFVVFDGVCYYFGFVFGIMCLIMFEEVGNLVGICFFLVDVGLRILVLSIYF